MSADVDPNTLPKLTKKQLKELSEEISYWLKVSRETPDKGLSLVAAGVAMGTKMTIDTIIQD